MRFDGVTILAKRADFLAAARGQRVSAPGFTLQYRERRADETGADAPVFADDSAITLPTQLLEAVMAAGRKGQKIQRYKGLGEMNAEQLWETTLDPDNRALLQVKVEDADVTDEIFTRLMGDVVEPRREFIQSNALNVANLDV